MDESEKDVGMVWYEHKLSGRLFYSQNLLTHRNFVFAEVKSFLTSLIYSDSFFVFS